MLQQTNNRDALIGWAFHAAGLTAALLLLCLFYSAVYRPLVDQRERECARIEQIDSLLEKSSTVQRQHRQLRRRLESLEEAIEGMRGRLPEKLQAYEFESQVRQIAQQEGVQGLAFQHRRPEEKPTHKQAVVEFEGSGSFASICRFLAQVEKLSRITKVASLNIYSEAELGHNTVRGSFVLYYGVTSHDREEKGEVL